MASLQARHQRNCQLGRPWTTFAAAKKGAGCTCLPTYFTVHRHDGELIRDPVGHDRKVAERALDALRGDVARRTYRVVEEIRFDEWADRWLAGFTGKENSRRVYAHTIAYAKATFGATKIRDLTPADVRRFLERVREAYVERHPVKEGEQQREVAPASLAKHLRQLAACLQAAIAEGYATANPVRGLHRSARPKVEKNKPTYYTAAELARLWPELAFRPVMIALCKTAVATGARFGELAALRWDDVDLLNRELHISRTLTDGIGETSTKSNEPRVVDLTPPAAKVLEAWFTLSEGTGRVFEREDGTPLSSTYVLRQVLYPALERAGIPRVGERGRKRDFHSFRHTFARIALEGGAEITWVQRQLGHSSIVLTVDTYGEWARAAQKAQAEKLADAFTL
jgi:integrase